MQTELNASGCERRVCAKCRKEIKGQTVYHVPPTYLIQLGLDSLKTFHPKCYEGRVER